LSGFWAIETINPGKPKKDEWPFAISGKIYDLFGHD
jgi:hypothetical protein